MFVEKVVVDWRGVDRCLRAIVGRGAGGCACRGGGWRHVRNEPRVIKLKILKLKI